jgi:hypothetical protein
MKIKLGKLKKPKKMKSHYSYIKMMETAGKHNLK